MLETLIGHATSFAPSKYIDLRPWSYEPEVNRAAMEALD